MSQQPPAAASPPPQEGQGASDDEALPRKYGKYTLLRRLAAGGMAELFLALHRSVASFEKLVVIKRILPELSRDSSFITMLLQEARIAATFSHPNIVTIFDVGQVEGQYFIAMEHIHGEDLRSIVRAMKPNNVTEFPLEHAIAITLGVAAGLAYAHEKADLNGNPLRIVHRDISPQNVLVTFTGDIKVVDFGIAKAARAGGPAVEIEGASNNAAGEHHTRVGQIKGKVPYMSPEQARGEDLDGRSDIFSLGVILFELATGRRLFRGPNDLETIAMITLGEYPRPSEVNPRISAALERVIMKALAKNRDERYATARELQGDLEEVVRAERIPVSTLSLANWMQMLFEERLASQREALLQGKQLADVIAADEPVETASGLTPGAPAHSLLPAPQPPSRTPWLAALAALVVIAGVSVGFYLRQESARASVAEAERLARRGAIEVRSEPPGAAIWLNGAPTPYRTPHTLEQLATGPSARYEVRVSADGYAPFAREVALAEPAARASVRATLERARASGVAVLELRTSPPGATVLVDGRAVPGRTPLTVPELAPDVEHSIVVRHDDALDERFTFSARAGELSQRTLALRERPLGPDEAWLTASVEPEAARVRLGDRELEGGPLFRVRVHAGAPLALHVSAPGYESETRSVRARPGETLAVPPVRLARARASSGSNANANARVLPAPTATAASAPVDRRPGSLRVGSSPWCNVTVDGAARGQTPVDLASIAPGVHTVVCNNPEVGSQTRRVTVTPGQLTIERFRLP